MPPVTGTPREILLDGTSFDVKADADITINVVGSEKEGIPTTGRTFIKKTRKSANAESIPLQVEAVEMDLLEDLHERNDSFPISITFADGSSFKTTGSINWENYTSAEGTAPVTVIPDRSVNPWERFAA